MTLPDHCFVKCAVCGEESFQTGLASSNEFGSPDLDTRPPEMYRSTMNMWLQRCPRCNYVAEDLNDSIGVPTFSQEWLNGEAYLSFGKHKPNSELLETFFLKVRISRYLADWKTAFWDSIHAAWVADDPAQYENEECEICYIDEGDTYWSFQARLYALDMFDNIPVDEIEETWKVVRADLLRKSSQFDRLIAEYTNLQFSDEILNQIVSFQIERAKLRDTKTYTIAEAISDYQ